MNPDLIINDSSDCVTLALRDRSGQRFEIIWIGATQATETLGTAANNVLDGTATPARVYVLSSQANDTDAGTGDARKVAIIGVSVDPQEIYSSANAKLTVEVVNLAGTTAVLTKRAYVRLLHAYVCDWGSGGQDAKGNITIDNNGAGGTIYLTITATYNESNNSVLYFPENRFVLIGPPSFANSATLAAGDGVVLTCVKSKFEDILNGDEDFATEYWDYIHYGYKPIVGWDVPRLTTIQSSLTFQETTVANSKTIQIKILVSVQKIKSN